MSSIFGVFLLKCSQKFPGTMLKKHFVHKRCNVRYFVNFICRFFIQYIYRCLVNNFFPCVNYFVSNFLFRYRIQQTAKTAIITEANMAISQPFIVSLSSKKKALFVIPVAVRASRHGFYSEVVIFFVICFMEIQIIIHIP